jgi:hypothetical protein
VNPIPGFYICGALRSVKSPKKQSHVGSIVSIVSPSPKYLLVMSAAAALEDVVNQAKKASEAKAMLWYSEGKKGRSAKQKAFEEMRKVRKPVSKPKFVQTQRYFDVLSRHKQAKPKITSGRNIYTSLFLKAVFDAANQDPKTGITKKEFCAAMETSGHLTHEKAVALFRDISNRGRTISFAKFDGFLCRTATRYAIEKYRAAKGKNRCAKKSIQETED